MTKQAIQIRKLYRRAAFGTINKSNGYYYFMDKKDGRIYRMGGSQFTQCPRLPEPYIGTFAIPETTNRLRFSQYFDSDTNTFILTEHEE